jgi:hypothetical protein
MSMPVHRYADRKGRLKLKRCNLNFR